MQRSSDERDLEVVFARLPRVRNLNVASQAVARELVAWRERTAAAQDRTVQSVLPDAVLVEIAKRRPANCKAAARHPRRRRRAPCAGARRRCSRRWRAGASAPTSRSRTAHARASPTPPTRRWSRSPKRSCAPARRRPTSPTSWSPRARTCRRSSPPGAAAPRRPMCAHCAAGAASWSGASCWSC